MRKCLYLKLAAANVRRSREVYVPYFIATAIMACCHFLVCCMCESRTMSNTPSGETAQTIFMMTLSLFTIFVFIFMLYINGFLIKRRQREFGLYGVLGMSRRHIGRVLRHELRMVIFGGVAVGMLMGMVFGRLLFMLVMRVLHVAEGSTFDLPPAAFVITGGLYVLVYIACAVVNAVRVRFSSPSQLLSSHMTGEKDSRFVLPMALLGTGLLVFCYVVAWTTEKPVNSMLYFLPLAMLVIVATYLVFTSGSIAALRVLRGCKRVYYKRANFVAISGMFHRMRQNARGLATICVMATMLLVAEAFSISLYSSQESVLIGQFPNDVLIELRDTYDDVDLDAVDALAARMADEYGVVIITEGTLDRYLDGAPLNKPQDELDAARSSAVEYPHMIAVPSERDLIFDLSGDPKHAVAYTEDLLRALSTQFQGASFGLRSRCVERERNYGLYGGILFMGVFFSVVFLTMTVLLIYFKQITEGYEDKRNFDIMRKVGMSHKQIKDAINRQISMVFFLPLIVALLHIAMATPMLARGLTIFAGSAGSHPIDSTNMIRMTYLYAALCALLFAVVYFCVYRATSKVYFRIVKG